MNLCQQVTHDVWLCETKHLISCKFMVSPKKMNHRMHWQNFVPSELKEVYTWQCVMYTTRALCFSYNSVKVLKHPKFENTCTGLPNKESWYYMRYLILPGVPAQCFIHNTCAGLPNKESWYYMRYLILPGVPAQCFIHNICLEGVKDIIMFRFGLGTLHEMLKLGL